MGRCVRISRLGLIRPIFRLVSVLTYCFADFSYLTDNLLQLNFPEKLFWLHMKKLSSRVGNESMLIDWLIVLSGCLDGLIDDHGFRLMTTVLLIETSTNGISSTERRYKRIALCRVTKG